MPRNFHRYLLRHAHADQVANRRSPEIVNEQALVDSAAVLRKTGFHACGTPVIAKILRKENLSSAGLDWNRPKVVHQFIRERQNPGFAVLCLLCFEPNLVLVQIDLVPGDLLSLTNADAAEVQEDQERVETSRQYFEQRAKFLVVDESLPSGVLFLHREVRDVLKFAVLLCEVEHATEKSESTIDRGPLRTLSEPLLNELLNRVGVDAADQHPPERLIEMLEAANAGFTVLLVTERLILLVAVLKKERSADVFVPEFLVELSVTVLRFAQTLAEQRFRN